MHRAQHSSTALKSVPPAHPPNHLGGPLPQSCASSVHLFLYSTNNHSLQDFL
jgi:hypothetical protein